MRRLQIGSWSSESQSYSERVVGNPEVSSLTTFAVAVDQLVISGNTTAILEMTRSYCRPRSPTARDRGHPHRNRGHLPIVSSATTIRFRSGINARGNCICSVIAFSGVAAGSMFGGFDDTRSSSIEGHLRYDSAMKPLPAPTIPGKTDTERFNNALRKVFTVPKEEMQRREAERRKAQGRKPHPTK